MIRLRRLPLCETTQKHLFVGNPEIITLQIVASELDKKLSHGRQ